MCGTLRGGDRIIYTKGGNSLTASEWRVILRAWLGSFKYFYSEQTSLKGASFWGDRLWEVIIDGAEREANLGVCSLSLIK